MRAEAVLEVHAADRQHMVLDRAVGVWRAPFLVDGGQIQRVQPHARPRLGGGGGAEATGCKAEPSGPDPCGGTAEHAAA